MANEIDSRIGEILRKLSKYRITCYVSAYELSAYLQGPTYTGDKISAEIILGNDLLLLHEVAEICVLKSMGYSIDEETIVRAYPVTYRAHLEAMRVELRVASEEGLSGWVEARCRDLQSYLEDPSLFRGLEKLVESLIKEFCKQMVLPQST